MTDADPSGPLRRAMGFRDVLLYLLITSFSIQSLAIGAGAGPSGGRTRASGWSPRGASGSPR